jgi:DNA polymerase
MTACRPYLWTQLALVRPRILLLAGASALKGVLGIPTGITKIRGQWLPTPPEAPFYGVEAMAIFHPSYLLRNASKAVGSPKWLMWQDIQEIRRRLDALEIPVHGQNLKT